MNEWGREKGGGGGRGRGGIYMSEKLREGGRQGGMEGGRQGGMEGGRQGGMEGGSAEKEE